MIPSRLMRFREMSQSVLPGSERRLMIDGCVQSHGRGRWIQFLLSAVLAFVSHVGPTARATETVYDGKIIGREVLTPSPPAEPRITGATIFGVRPGKPIRFCVSATGDNPIQFSATGLPSGVVIDSATGWITGRAPQKDGDVQVTLPPFPPSDAKPHSTQMQTATASTVADAHCGF